MKGQHVLDEGHRVLERVGTWKSLSRWEKSELGKDLRRLGLSYGEIMDLVPVKKSTLATWCRDVALSADQIAAIKERRGTTQGESVDTQWRRRLEVEQIRRTATGETDLLQKDPFWLAGLVLYWGEGGKVRNSFELANSDPFALRLFINWVRRYHDPAAEFVLHINLHANNDEPAARHFWSQTLDLPEARFHKSFIKPEGTGHRKNHLAHGVCRVKVLRSANMWQITMAWIQAMAPRLGH
jgi:hypothetical protein